MDSHAAMEIAATTAEDLRTAVRLFIGVSEG
jgi:hypothetical protein